MALVAQLNQDVFSQRLQMPSEAISGHKGAKGAGKGDLSSQEDQVVAGFAKALQAVRGVLGNSEQLSAADFAKTDLGQSLAQDPFWKGVANGDSDAKSVKKEDVVNFFYLIFKYMKTTVQQNNQMELNQALNLVVQSNLLDNITAESVSSVNTMKTDIQSAEHKLNSPLGQFLSIGLPILIAAASVAITAGAGSLVTSDLAKTAVTLAGSALGASSGAISTGTTNPATQEMSNAGAEGQADMSVNSSASESAQNMIKQGTQTEQNSQSNIQAALSMLQQSLSQMVSIFGMGH